MYIYSKQQMKVGISSSGFEMMKEEKDGVSVLPMPLHFVLIHGIGGGAWCWYKMKTLMENCGHKVTCLDLKGAGIDPTDPNTILSFHQYNQPLIDFLSSLHHHQQVILVGHSAGGLSLSDAILKFGKKKKIKLAVFVAATMLKFGFLSHQDIKDGVPDLSGYGEMNEVYDMGFGLGEGNPPTTTLVKKELVRKIIYPLCPQEDATLAAMLLRPGPVQALITAKFGSESDKDDDEEEEEEVPRIYVKTTQDNVIKPEQQEAMINKWPPSHVYVLDTDHSPFLSAPLLLFGILLNAALSLG